MDAWEKYKISVNKTGLVKPKDKVLVALSGGPDSVCMLHLLWRLRKICDIKLAAVYVDHGLRKQAKKEVRFIEKLCAKLDVPVSIRSVSVKKYSASNKVSTETAGRILRYETLISTAKQLKFNKIATGHNANDNAETILMWLIRGTGSEGMSGIPQSRSAQTDNKRLKIVRPILPLTRTEIIAYLKRQKLSYCIDHTNKSFDYTRNKLRHNVVHLLEG